ncbi:hypothetical protein lerEdw1_013953 [Lerista edwardsae]|nr:hypothetical protein lerEdw1_013955 [Lerista edwardsae]KAJ6634569.1 hypothetical protein lerEdw1_013953 [Lerista edwardsae]
MKAVWQLLFLGLVCSSVLTADDGIGPPGKKSKKRPKIKEEDNVLVLNKGNFDRALDETKYLLVEFYISLSGPSQTLATEFAKAAEQLKKEAVDIRLGKVDVTEQKDLKKEFDIQEYPTLKFFVDGNRKNPRDCKGVREASGFVTWVQRQIGPSTVLLNSTDQAKAFLEPEELAVIGFFKSLQGKAVEGFSDSARDVPELPFGLTANEEVFAQFGIREDMVVVFQEGKPVHNEAPAEGKLDKVELTRLIKTFTMDLVTEYNLETSVKIFDVPVENHIVLFIPKSSSTFNRTYENFLSAAPEFRGKVSELLFGANSLFLGLQISAYYCYWHCNTILLKCLVPILGPLKQFIILKRYMDNISHVSNCVNSSHQDVVYGESDQLNWVVFPASVILQIMFILVDTDETRNGRVIEYFRVTAVEVPAVQILNLTSDARYKLPAEEVTTENLRHFCKSYLEGTAKCYWSSEEIPEGWDKMPVKVLVGKNFDRVAFNEKNHVFVMFCEYPLWLRRAGLSHTKNKNWWCVERQQQMV